MLIENAIVVRCPACMAPYRRPLSDGWTATCKRVRNQDFVMIHRPQCPDGWQPKAGVPS